MRHSKSKALTFLALASALSGARVLPKEPDNSHSKSNKMPLTDEELTQLSLLSGKLKKFYVKQLRDKYYGVKNDSTI